MYLGAAALAGAMEPPALAAAAAATVLALATALLWWWRHASQDLYRIPSPPCWPIIGAWAVQLWWLGAVGCHRIGDCCPFYYNLLP